jgi:hypothetical protein
MAVELEFEVTDNEAALAVAVLGLVELEATGSAIIDRAETFAVDAAALAELNSSNL